MSLAVNGLDTLTAEDEAAIDRLNGLGEAMHARTLEWAAVNTGSWNTEGLLAFAPTLKAAFEELDAEVRLVDTPAFETVNAKGELEKFQSGPVLRVSARPEAPVQVVMTGHYDTVFPPGTFETIQDLGDGRTGGPGVADMKGGLIVLLEALKAFEAGPLKDRLGYQIAVTPDEETGNFASEPFLREAASDGALVGMTYEPAMETGAMSGARKGSAVYDITFHGHAAHAGRAFDEGRSAIYAAAEFTAAVEALNGQRDGVTFNVGSIEGGAAVNIVPDVAVVRMGARAPDAQSAEWGHQGVKAAYDKACARDGITGHLHGGFYRPPKPRNAAQQALFDAVAGTGKALGLSLEFQDTGGVCEGNNIFAAGVPNVDTLGVRGGRIHSSEEFVVRDSFSERAALSALLLNRFADERIDAGHIKSLMTDK